ncbi:hypothetical protein C6H88_02615 [Chlamydia muridarum str. Nigg]|uniref:Membrane protein n=2 Tax=Chlamydia muridarum TaxID=83560 RepID=A0A070A116_CHLMR|nr:conserved hypothetical protein [Chlamydia muridarum str. Nigg]AHH22894.1 membrane protein [Chlamydia muridarum str. Nigg3 CMUT3-5]AHH23819.1 membrane protein [Chlamydia muridarum str. Nigg CM972]AID38028.1 membrane protein [Chlamydia muridarum str. Nigg 2 MCR]AIT90690.1 membrane protein [Chlamydia muridarum]UFW99761.1 hypothetical protein FTM85_02720 [Chlamydia trachomatis]
MRALRFLLSLRRGEEKRALLFLLLGLVWSVACYGSLALGESLFLEEIGTKKLPFAYLGASFFLCFISCVVLYSLSRKRASPKALFLSFISCVLVCNLYLFWHLAIHRGVSGTPIFLYRILIWGLTILCYANFWGFVDQFFNIQDAKRHFCIFNAITFCGDFLGARIVNQIQHLGAELILLSFIAVIVFTFPLVHYISSSLKELSEDHDLFLDTGYPPSAKQAFKLCLKDKYTFYLVSFYFLLQLLVVFTEFNYLKIFDAQFGNAKNFELTENFTKYSSWISLGNMFFALFAYSRVITRFGINNIILFAPICFFSLFVCWSIKTSVLIATMGMIAREGLAYALDDNNLQLLIYGIPNKIRNQVRIAIESFVEPAGMFICALLCLFIPHQYILCIIISAVCILLALLLRTRYSGAILRNLSLESLHLRRSISEWFTEMNDTEKRQAEILLLTHLKNPQERHQMFAFQHLLNLKNRAVLPNLLLHMNKLGLSGKLRTLNMLKNSVWAKDFLTLELLKRWSSLPQHPAIATAIHLYFVEHDLLSVSDVADDLYDQSGDRLFAAILTVRKHKPCGEYQALAQRRLTEILQSEDPELIIKGLSILSLERKPSNFLTILPFLTHSNERVFLQACLALESCADKQYSQYGSDILTALQKTKDLQASIALLNALSPLLNAPLIQEFITITVRLKNILRKQAEVILASLSKECVPILIEIISNPSLHNNCRIMAAKALSRIDNRQLKRLALKILKSKAAKALFYDYHKNFIQKRYPHYDLHLLIETLEANYHAEVNFMLTFLAIIGSTDYADVLIRSLTGKNLKARAQALESLEKDCESHLFTLVTPFVYRDTHAFNEKYYMKKGVEPLAIEELLNWIETTPFHLSKLAALQLKEELSLCDAEFSSALQNFSKKQKTSILPREYITIT